MKIKLITVLILLFYFFPNYEIYSQNNKINVLEFFNDGKIDFPSLNNYLKLNDKTIRNLQSVNYNQFQKVSDSNSRLDSVIAYDENGNEYISINSYTPDRQLASAVKKIKYGQSPQWENDSKESLEYDTDGNKVSSVYETWDGNQWVNSQRYSYGYDANGNMTFFEWGMWDGNQWSNGFKFTMTYNSNGFLVMEIYHVWDGTAWSDNLKTSYTNDSNGNIITEIIEGWYGTQWENLNRYSFTYDTNGSMITELHEHWAINQWVTNNRFFYTYTLNELLTKVQETWQGSEWVNFSQHLYTYDLNGNRLSLLYQIWNNSQWVDEWRDIYTYDSNNSCMTGIHQKWVSGNWETRYWSLDFKSYYANRLFIYYCSHFTAYYSTVTGIDNDGDIFAEAYSLSQNYPNPFNPSTTIKYSIPSVQTTRRVDCTLKVYDILGKEVATLVNEQQQPGDYEVEFDATDLLTGRQGLSSGIYYYQLRTGEFVQTKKC